MSIRRLLMAQKGEGGILPKGYTQCEYLESNGHQIIDTGLYFDPSTLEVQCTFMTLQWGGAVFGSRNSAASDNSSMQILSSSSGYYRLDFVYPTNAIVRLPKDVIYKSTFIRGYAKMNDNEYNYQIIPSPDVNVNSFCMFGLKQGSDAAYNLMSNHRIYDVRLYESGNNVCVLVPAIDRLGKPCMYDTIRKLSLYNRGTGEFGYKTLDGVIVNPT